MRYENLQGLKLPKIGFGTWSIGGREKPEARQDASSLAALRSALALGYTHFDTAEMYAAGHCEELLGRAIRESGVDRSSLFLTSKVSAENLSAQGVVNACAASLSRLRTDYLDLYLIHWPNRSIPLSETFKGLNQLRRYGKVHHLGVSNFDLALLKEAQALSESPLLTNQVPLSISDRSYLNSGVVEYCQSNGIIVTAYSPVKGCRLRSGHAVKKLAAERNLTPCQLALAWVVSQLGVITIPMSIGPQHQRENLAVADIVLTSEEMRRLA